LARTVRLGRRAIACESLSHRGVQVRLRIGRPHSVAPPAGAQSETVHYGGAHEEIVRSEADTAAGRIADTPFAVLAQQSLFDSKRAPAGRSHGGGVRSRLLWI
jgi:phytoene dehydrogenase-like protein